MDRLVSLKEVLAQNPDDTFARYALAMEYSRLGEIDTALAEFTTLREKHPEYIAAYQMAAQMLASAERIAEARHWLEQGIAAAQRVGNRHAQSEMEMLRDELPE